MPRLRHWLARITKRHRALLFFGTAFGSVVIALALLNFTAPTEKIEQPLPRLYAAGDAQFERVMSEMLGPAVVAGNHIELLRNGDQIFPAMLGAIRAAQQSITFESFVFSSGDISDWFIEAFTVRARWREGSSDH